MRQEEITHFLPSCLRGHGVWGCGEGGFRDREGRAP